MTGIEDQLRDMLHADAEKIQHSNLRPPATFAPPRARRTGWFPTTAAVLAGAAATVAILVGPDLLKAHAPTSSDLPPAAGVSQARLTITFTTGAVTASPPGVSVAVPRAHVYATNPQAAERVSDVIEEELAYAVSAFESRASEMIELGSDPRHMSGRITVADMTTWHRYLSVRFDTSMEVGAAHPINESAALTFDTDTGARILSTDLFTDTKQAGTVVRNALLASRTDGSLDGFDLSALSLAPSEAGTTTPLNCYPTPVGLHCLVDQWTLAPYVAGLIETTIPWEQLAPLLRPGVGA